LFQRAEIAGISDNLGKAFELIELTRLFLSRRWFHYRCLCHKNPCEYFRPHDASYIGRAQSDSEGSDLHGWGALWMGLGESPSWGGRDGLMESEAKQPDWSVKEA
jgi:hypothetical protein